MKVESITFLSDLNEIEDIFDDNTDVVVKLDDGHEYVVVVATQKNLLTLMNSEKSDFLSPGDPMIIVRKITQEVVEEAIKSYLSYRNKYDMQVKLQIIQSFANTPLRKEFRVLEFLQKFRSTPNAIKAHIKDLILQAFQALLQEKLIRKQITLFLTDFIWLD